ncbi:hypothetical protein GCM10017655_12610 [Pseudomonas turukhanskensis]|uniref:Uncharacterized protein n=1 Tax=Pseudomonas turukhanskensis TaxID=1806536 RepID=A0A9W6K572_9PSED|nr:hypothetical protein GCM10017655_12610 [Pseudomonas turukhanskensis]
MAAMYTTKVISMGVLAVISRSLLLVVMRMLAITAFVVGLSKVYQRCLWHSLKHGLDSQYGYYPHEHTLGPTMGVVQPHGCRE